MRKNNKELGKRGEDIAERYLGSLGMEILERNFYIWGGEIDIIAKDGGTYVFAEVKTRTSILYGTGAEAITPKKKHSLQRTAEVYAAGHGILNEPMRFDVVEINIDTNGNHSIRYIKNAQMDG
jgi:putative endonuclease